MLFQTGDHREVLNFFFFNDTATTEIYTLSLHDALPILLIVKKSALRRSLLPPKARKGKPRTVVDTNVLVAGIAGVEGESTNLDPTPTQKTLYRFRFEKKNAHRIIRACGQF